MALTVVILYFSLRTPASKRTQRPKQVKKVEYPSAALLLACVASPLLALNLGGDVVSWSHPAVVGLLCATPILFALFIRIDARAANPMMPMRFLRNRRLAIVFACILPMKACFDQV